MCISIETRRQLGETYSPVKGLFRQYELTYVVGDERDLVRCRTGYRKEQVYLYRAEGSPEVLRNVFLDYIRTINSLRDHPQWYNTLTGNCTTQIRGHVRPFAERASRWSWKLVLNGYVDEMAYENGTLDGRLTFHELKIASHVNARARAADDDPHFSTRIREGLPGF